MLPINITFNKKALLTKKNMQQKINNAKVTLLAVLAFFNAFIALAAFYLLPKVDALYLDFVGIKQFPEGTSLVLTAVSVALSAIVYFFSNSYVLSEERLKKVMKNNRKLPVSKAFLGMTVATVLLTSVMLALVLYFVVSPLYLLTDAV